MRTLALTILLAVFLSLFSCAVFARNDGQPNGAGCINNCGNTRGDVVETSPESSSDSASSALAFTSVTAQGGLAQSSSEGGAASSDASSQASGGQVSNSVYSANVNNYEAAAQAVAAIVTTNCGQAAGASTPQWSVSLSKGHGAFCQNLELASVFFELGRNDRAMEHLEAASQLTDIDTWFDNLTTIITFGLLK